jgi:hypothetical protein
MHAEEISKFNKATVRQELTAHRWTYVKRNIFSTTMRSDVNTVEWSVRSLSTEMCWDGSFSMEVNLNGDGRVYSHAQLVTGILKTEILSNSQEVSVSFPEDCLCICLLSCVSILLSRKCKYMLISPLSSVCGYFLCYKLFRENIITCPEFRDE